MLRFLVVSRGQTMMLDGSERPPACGAENGRSFETCCPRRRLARSDQIEPAPAAPGRVSEFEWRSMISSMIRLRSYLRVQFGKWDFSFLRSEM